MTNAELFKKTFGIRSEEFWSYTEKQMLDWINADVPDTNVGDLISRNYAIKHYQHVCRRTNCKECPLHIQVTDTLTDCELELFLHNLPSAEPDVNEYRKRGEWDMFELITSAWYGKRYYFKEEDNDMVYSRNSHKTMTVDDAILEFIREICDD